MPAAPATLTVVSKTTISIALNWTLVVGADSYNVLINGESRIVKKISSMHSTVQITTGLKQKETLLLTSQPSMLQIWNQDLNMRLQCIPLMQLEIAKQLSCYIKQVYEKNDFHELY